MPLVLGGVETQRPQAVVWDPLNADEANDAAKRVADLIKQGFNLMTTVAGEALLTPPKKDPNFGVFRILSKEGDERLVWDRRAGPEIKDAYKKFNSLIASGYSAYAVNAAGQKGHKITEFDPALEEIIMVPSTMPG